MGVLCSNWNFFFSSFLYNTRYDFREDNIEPIWQLVRQCHIHGIFLLELSSTSERRQTRATQWPFLSRSMSREVHYPSAEVEGSAAVDLQVRVLVSLMSMTDSRAVLRRTFPLKPVSSPGVFWCCLSFCRLLKISSALKLLKSGRGAGRIADFVFILGGFPAVDNQSRTSFWQKPPPQISNRTDTATSKPPTAMPSPYLPEASPGTPLFLLELGEVLIVPRIIQLVIVVLLVMPTTESPEMKE